MTFHMPDSYYDPPDEIECDCPSPIEPFGADCTCEQDAADGLADYLIEQAEARREARDRENREHYEAKGEW